MDQFIQTFVHYPQFKVIVCKKCSYAVTQAQFPAHLFNSHRFLPAKTRREMVEVVKGIKDLAEEEKEVVYPEPGSPAIPHLPKFKNGKKCIPCGYIRRTLSDIQQHCRDKHKWENSRNLECENLLGLGLDS